MRLPILVTSALILSASFLGLSYLASQERLATLDLGPTDDAYVVRDMGSLTSPVESKNTGSSPVLITAYSFVPGNHTLAFAYLRFDLSGLTSSSITNASLHLFVSDLVFTAFSRHIDLRYVNNSNWSERTVNYLNSPPFEKGILASTIVSQKDRHYSWDLTDFARQHAPNPVTLMVSLDAVFVNKTEFAAFSSKEASTTPPQLIIQSIAPPPTFLTAATTAPGYYLTGLIIASTFGLLIAVLWRPRRFASSDLCPSCSRRVKQGFSICPYCGARLDQS